MPSLRSLCWLASVAVLGCASSGSSVAPEDPVRPARDGGTRLPDAKAPVIDDRYVDLAITVGKVFDRSKGDKHPTASFTPPTGWSWYDIEGGKCRDGSPFGVFVHWGEDLSKLFVYFEGGGACANPGFCDLNPKNVSEQFLTGGESALASLFILPVPQAPNGAGVFDLANPANPFLGWSQVFVPYCTGDVYAGTRTNVTIEGVTEPQNFYGAANVKKVIARLAATFRKDLRRFVAGGSSAGGYGAGINFGYLQDTFKDAYGTVLLDASPPFTNDYVPACLQQRWRDSWGVDGNYPPDCGGQCRSADGGNLFQIVDYWRMKYPNTNVALISGIHDEIIRLFFSLGNDDCKNYAMDPPSLFVGTLAQTYPPEQFAAGLEQLRSKYLASGQLATYYMDGLPNATAHQCLFRNRLYEKAAGADKPTIAEFLKTWIDGKMTQVGP
jgi:Pectinacetylesterase